MIKGLAGQSPWFLLPCLSSLYTSHISAARPQWRWLSQGVKRPAVAHPHFCGNRSLDLCPVQWHPLAGVLPQSMLGRKFLTMPSMGVGWAIMILEGSGSSFPYQKPAKRTYIVGCLINHSVEPLDIYFLNFSPDVQGRLGLKQKGLIVLPILTVTFWVTRGK